MKRAILLGLAFIVGMSGYLVYQMWSPSRTNSPSYRQLSSESNCFLQERACTATDEQALITLTLDPKPVRLMQPVQATMQIAGLKNIDTVELKIEGINMYMGFQQVQLTKHTDLDWEGNFSLPICSESEMQWQVTATLHSIPHTYQASFSLVTQR